MGCLIALFKWGAIGLIALYFGVLGLLYVNQRSFLFHPDTRAITPAQAGLTGFEAVTMRDGSTSWWHPPANAKAPIIIHLHGNGGALAGRA